VSLDSWGRNSTNVTLMTGSNSWSSHVGEIIGAVEGFAGREIAKAVVEPEAVAALIDFDECVQHYEVIEEA
jgi:hypothetical protein